ncbi:Lrp/AsnC family transcriptional regulator [uncultured Shimia sp.]|uniref:Lrp/AsnC family transcriptional regulator n=1 Tax=uncultured Shimia sp. TaxID=573152 RepID=UPI00261F20ED|nr:Lrp/AsnC family transcriptional regulator [uncultured Shimia sp.]
MTKATLDATDHKIIAVLQTEGRISNLDLAERVGLSPTPCSRRVKRLEDTGVITGYGARIDPDVLGHGVSVMVNIRLSRQSPSDIKEFLAAVHSLPEITECLLVTGNLDYILKIRTRDVDALKEFVLSKLKNVPCVSETTTMLILETVKSTE